jgi:putative peptidoglycan lipid II flippase
VTIGVGLAMSVSNAVGAGLSLILLRRRIGSADGRTIFTSHLRFVFAAIGSASATWLTALAIGLLGLPPRVDAVATLMIAGPVMLGLYLGLLRSLGTPEVDIVLSPVLSRLGRSTSIRVMGRHRR